MIRTLLLASLLLAAAPAWSGDLEALDAANGFEGARLGTPVDSFDGLELVTSHGARGTAVYTREGLAPKLGDAQLDDVTYGFYQNRLYFVALFTSGRRNAQAALAALREAYGPGTRLPGEASEYIWQGDRVVLHFREDPVTRMGMVGFRSREIDGKFVQSPAAPAD